jgi:hypothetical protein
MEAGSRRQPTLLETIQYILAALSGKFVIVDVPSDMHHESFVAVSASAGQASLFVWTMKCLECCPKRCPGAPIVSRPVI